MGYFKQQKTVKVDFPSNKKSGKEYFAVVKTELKWSDTKQYTVMNEDGTADIMAGADAFLNNAIQEWNLDDDAGTIVPITTGNVDLLDQEDALALIAAAGGSLENPAAKKNSTNK